MVSERDFDGKTVAVVGNSRMIMEHQDGKYIDGHDIVLRFNYQVPQPDQFGSIGSKTTHMSLVARKKTQAFRDSNPSIECFLPTTVGLRNLGPHEPIWIIPSIVRNTWKESWLGTNNRRGVEPSSGSIVIWMLMHFCTPRAVSVYGFDGMITTDFYKPNKKHARCHHKESERIFLRSMEERGNFRMKRYGSYCRYHGIDDQ